MAVPEQLEAPSEPPPLLRPDQIKHIAFHGWLSIAPPEYMLNDLDHLSSVSQSFFDQELEAKTELYPASRGTECGFYTVPGEKEYVTFRYRKIPESALEQQVQNIWRQSALLLHRILCDLSRAGEYNVHIWDHLIDGALDLPASDRDLENIISLMRIFRYYPNAGVAEEHVDIGLLTLCIGGARGLQVLDRERNEYVDAVGPTVLVGDMARVLLKSRVRAGMHRVKSNPEGRSSVVFALRPNLTNATDLAMFGGEGIVSTKEFFYRIKGSKYNINATKDIREEQQREQRLMKEKRRLVSAPE